MNKRILLPFALLCFSLLTNAQVLEFQLADPQPFLQGSDTGDMEFADLDGDGDSDLIITGSGNMSDGTAHGAKTTLYFNDGTGSFTEVTSHGIENIRVSKIALANIDSDADIDLLISGFTTGGIALTKLYRNDGSGNFTEVSGTPFTSLENGYFNFGDIDGDNDQDIVFSGSEIPTVVAFLNDGDGIFSLAVDIGVNNIGGVLELFDADGDDDLDLLITGTDNSDAIATRLFRNNGSGAFTAITDAGLNNINLGDIAAGDTDNDGDLDVLITGSKSDFSVVSEFYTNNGDGTFTWVTDAPFLGLGFDGEASFNDFDNDGDLDVYIIGSAEGGLPNIYSHVYENLGSNNFVLSDEFVGGYLSTHAVADIDGDGFKDIVFGGTTTGSPVRGSFLYTNITEANLNVPDVTSLDSIELYPNPTNGLLQIDLRNQSNANLSIYDLTGKRLFNSSLLSGINTLQLSLPNGVYIASIDSQENRFTQKLVVRN